MVEVGGYFELELPAAGGQAFHAGARVALKSGRACLRLLLEQERPRRVRVPFYCCDSLLEPFLALGVEVEFVALDDALEIVGDGRALAPDERLVYVDYFGLKRSYAERLAAEHRSRLWLDNAQAYFVRPVDAACFAFNSARKFFGVADGGYLYAPRAAELPDPRFWARHKEACLGHLMLRHEGRTEEGLALFRENERRCGGPIARISLFSEKILGAVDYSVAAARRRENYLALDARLAASNRLPRSVIELDAAAVPFCYPYLPPTPVAKPALWRSGLFVPELWRECVDRRPSGFESERRLAAQLLPLPVDHRYGGEQMAWVADQVESRGS